MPLLAVLRPQAVMIDYGHGATYRTVGEQIWWNLVTLGMILGASWERAHASRFYLCEIMLYEYDTV
jgi:hypothetical protein